MKYILTDIEGTTTAITFVHDVLFPYSKQKLEKFVLTHKDNLEVKKCLEDVGSVDVFLKWIAEDKKEPALKILQGLIWEEGYKTGELKGHVYEDVLPALKEWKNEGIHIGIYSSGSVHAQKLLFKNSIYGDLTEYFSNYFDTSVGQKRQAQSYKSIASQLSLNPQDILFLSDIIEELDAAKEIGMHTMQLVRSDIPTSSKHMFVKNFKEIIIGKINPC
jgi:enolase-phosphatase E1